MTDDIDQRIRASKYLDQRADISHADYVDHPTHYLALVEIRDLKARVAELKAALQGLMDDIGDPEDVDQDCRFCSGHYGKHFPGCEWDIARDVLAKDKTT